MGASLFSSQADLTKRISDAVGVDVKKLCLESDEETLRQTQNAQIALYATGVLAYHDAGTRADALAGHSVGEYAALACAGIVSIEEGARLVKTRGEIMAASGRERPGTMAAVLGLERADLEKLLAEVSSGEVVVANDNCPGQLVISGDVSAVQEASEKATTAGARRVLPLNVSGAFHSPLMESSAREMRRALDQASFAAGSAKVYSNVLAAPIAEAARWPELLETQLRSVVRWTESVQAMIADGVTEFVECGAGEVLSGLIKRIDKSVAIRATNS